MFKRNRYHGQGVFQTWAGDVYEGNFVEGNFEGPGRLRRSNGEIIDAYFYGFNEWEEA